MNIELKSEILKNSIQIEDYLSKILMKLLDIENPKNKSFGTKGSALSFKSKADLLYDINKIGKDLYSDLILFMEIRNQFIHNADTNSFEIVNARITRKNRLSQLSETPRDIWESEYSLRQGFYTLCMEIMKGLLEADNKIHEEKVSNIQRQIDIIEKDQELKFKESVTKALADSIDQTIDELNDRFSINEYGRKINANNRLTNIIKYIFEKSLRENLKKEIGEKKKTES